jgi:hypothetical protein
MARRVVKQPNGRYAIWSSVVDNFVAINLSANGVVKYYTEDAIDEAYRIAHKSIEQADREAIPDPHDLDASPFDQAIHLIRVNSPVEADQLVERANRKEAENGT